MNEYEVAIGKRRRVIEADGARVVLDNSRTPGCDAPAPVR